MTDTAGGGREFLRAALRQRAGHGHLALYSRDLGIGIAALDAFAHGTGRLAPDALQKLAAHMFDANYDAAADLLSLARKPEPARSMVGPPSLRELGWVPPPICTDPMSRAPRPVKAVPVLVKAKRPGWVD